MSKEKLKNKNHTSNRGITLIALIITIIVMLILTGVTLSITLGDNGLVNKAQEASEEMQVAMDRELLLSAVVGTIDNNGEINLGAIVLPEGFTGSNGTYTSSNGHTFTVSENGEVVYGKNPIIEEEGIIETEIDITGKYYMTNPSNYDIEDYHIEAFSDGTFYQTLGDLTGEYVINHENKVAEMYLFGEKIGNAKINFVYDENNRIINKIIITDAGHADGNSDIILWQNTEGLETIEGEYVNGTSTKKIVFNLDNHAHLMERDSLADEWGGYDNPGGIGEDLYIIFDGICYLDYGEGTCEISDDLTQIVFEGETYTKQ